MRRAAALVLPSSFLLEVFARHGMPGRVVPNIIDLHRFRPAAAPREAGDAPHLVVARNLEPIYGNDVALQAFARILEHFPAARLTVAGSGPEAASLAELARTLGIAERVHFTGRLDRDQMAALYRDAHLMLNASRVDNMPNAILEALASGVPVVSSDVGGIPHMVRDRHTAMLVPPDDAPALADAALDVLRDAGLRAQLVANGLAEVRQYRWDSVRTVLATTYDDAMRAAPIAHEDMKDPMRAPSSRTDSSARRPPAAVVAWHRRSPAMPSPGRRPLGAQPASGRYNIAPGCWSGARLR